ncbi:MAG: hypothetical protein KDC35_08785 [Acidobacteria bacterium]|nr:hypothetical protein [Acidobacteriota bacterium]
MNDTKPSDNWNEDSVNRGAVFLLGLMLVTCSKAPITHPYGVDNGNSINGIGVFHALLKERGMKVTKSMFLDSDEDYDWVFCFDRYGHGLSEEDFESLLSFVDGADDPRVVFYICPTYVNNRAFWTEQSERFPDRDDLDQVRTFADHQPDRINHSLEVFPMTREAADLEMSLVYDWLDGDEIGQYPLDSVWTTDQYHDDLLYAENSAYATMIWSNKASDHQEGVVVFANAYMFLNYALVKAEHRDALNNFLNQFDFGSRACLVEFPGVSQANDNSILHFLKTFPINLLALQGLLLLALFLWRSSPIVGYGDRERVRERISFRKHLEAFGKLLADTGRVDAAFAIISRNFWRENPERTLSLDDAIEEINKKLESP